MSNFKLPAKGKSVSFDQWQTGLFPDPGWIEKAISLLSPIGMDTYPGNMHDVILPNLSEPVPAYMAAALIGARLDPIAFEAIMALGDDEDSIWDNIKRLYLGEREGAEDFVSAARDRIAGFGLPVESITLPDAVVVQMRLEDKSGVRPLWRAIYPASVLRAAPTAAPVEPVAVVSEPTPTKEQSVVAEDNIPTLDTVEAAPPSDDVAIVRLGRMGVIATLSPDFEKFTKDSRDMLSSLGVSDKLVLRAIRRTIAGRDVTYAVLPDNVAESIPFSMLHSEVGYMRASAIVPYDLTLPIESGVQIEFLEPGAAVLVAPTGWGKSQFMMRGLVPELRRRGYDHTVVAYVEPMEPVSLNAGATLIQAPSELLALIAETLLSEERRVLVIDSLRAFVYGKSAGGTGTKGFDQLLFTQLTAISNLALARGDLIFMSLNPLVDDTDEDRVREIHDGIKSSVTTSLLGRNPATRAIVVERRGLLSVDRGRIEGTVVSLNDLSVALEQTSVVYEDKDPANMPAGVAPAYMARLIQIN